MSEPEPIQVQEENASSSEGDVKKEKTEKEILRHDADYYPMREFRFPLMGTEIYLNPVTSLFGFAFLWALSIWCIAAPTKANTKLWDWQAGVTEKFTWFYISANPAFTFFVFWLAYRFGDVKLGKKDEKPEFDDSSYFMMLFSAGVAVGLFFYGVSEPLSHRSGNWFAEAGYKAQDEIDQWALMLTLYHWGFAGWSPYIVVAVAAGLGAYRFDLPMTVRSCLYVILGDWTWGWIGDMFDGFSIVMTVAGVCTSLGLGAMQIITGADRMGWLDDDLSEDELTNKQVTVIWVITAIATVSVVSGLSVGIKLLSQIGFGLGMILLLLCLIMEKTNYLFNLTVQTVGYYFQWCIFQVPFWTDAFGQLTKGEGRATDGNSASPTWMNGWTVFYMAWWTAWGAFVGLFLARISRGRTIRQVAMYSFIAPLVYSFMWFCTFGGIGLRQAREADELEFVGNESFGDPAHFRVPGSDTCYEVPQDPVIVDGETVFTNQIEGITPVCQLDSSDVTQAWFNVMYSFSFKEGEDEDFAGFGGFMAGLSMIALTIYFVTSSDSGSLIVDHLASNGHEDHHWIQRVFWAFTEGAVATALLVAGGSKALGALQAASIVFGLPFNLLLFCMMYCTVRMCNVSEEQDKAGNYEGKLPNPHDTSFKMPLFGGVFNIMEIICSAGSVHEERKNVGTIEKFHINEFVIGLFAPFLSLYRIVTKLDYPNTSKYAISVTYFGLFVLTIVLFALGGSNRGYVAFGACCHFLNACIVTVVRAEVRNRFSLAGNAVADFAAGFIFFPQAMCQMLYEFENNDGENNPAEDVAEEVVEQSQYKDVQAPEEADAEDAIEQDA